MVKADTKVKRKMCWINTKVRRVFVKKFIN